MPSSRVAIIWREVADSATFIVVDISYYIWTMIGLQYLSSIINDNTKENITGVESDNRYFHKRCIVLQICYVCSGNMRYMITLADCLVSIRSSHSLLCWLGTCWDGGFYSIFTSSYGFEEL